MIFMSVPNEERGIISGKNLILTYKVLHMLIMKLKIPDTKRTDIVSAFPVAVFRNEKVPLL